MEKTDQVNREAKPTGSIKTYRDLVVWQKSMTFVTEVYRITKTFPKEEQFGLVSQIRRCAVSVPSNVAEGYGRKSRGDYIRFLQLAMGSLFEVQTQLQTSLDLEFLDQPTFDDPFEKTREVERMLSALVRKLRPG